MFLEKNKLTIVTLLLALFVFGACSQINGSQKDSQKPDFVQAKPVQNQENKIDNELEKVDVEEQLPVYQAGDNISDALKDFKVKTLSGKKEKLTKLLGQDKTLVAVVKPGCVYCESMLAIKSATGVETQAKFLVLVAGLHADFKVFQEKYEKFKSAGGEWLFDEDENLKSKLGIDSYPRFLVIDKDSKLLEYKTGLVLPEDKSVLEGKQFPEILQMISENTMRWMKGF